MRPVRHLAAVAGSFAVAASMALAAPAVANAASDSVPSEASDLARLVNTAHRGASAYAPENTLAAFEVAIEMKSDLIESDVQLSKDGVPILMHDTTLSRTTNVEEVFPDRAPYRVSDFTVAELKQLDAGSWKGWEFAGEPIPTMAEMVEQVRPSSSGILMEIKSPHLYPGIEAAVAEVFDSFPGYVTSAVANDRLVVQSFNFDSMHTYSQIQPEVPVGLLGTPPVSDLPAYAEWAEQINPNFGSYDAAYVEQVHALGMDVHSWTINSADGMNAAIDLGVDGIITDRPDVLNDVLADRLAKDPAA